MAPNSSFVPGKAISSIHDSKGALSIGLSGLGKIKGGRIKPIPAKMTCSAVKYVWVVDKPAIQAVEANEEKNIKAVEAVAEVGHSEIAKDSSCRREKVCGFEAHISKRHRSCNSKGIWQRA